MPYDFSTLLPADFEDLAGDLVGEVLGVRFEAFGPGPDGGIDGRYAMSKGDIILQAKHYGGKDHKTLVAAMRKERPKIDRLAAERYILATSRQLSPGNKAELKAVIGPTLRKQADIFGRADLNRLLRRFGHVERAHLKLWLSSTTVLQTILEAIVHSGSHAFTASSQAEIAAKVKVYAQNPSLAEARKVLDQRHVLIISGPPGVGKTTLAEILSFAYLSEKWELIALRSLDDGFDRIDDSRNQIFFFDDFLGAIALDARALSEKESQLSRFMTRVRNSPNARFIMTTRAYILNEARLSSEKLADRHVELSTYILDLSAYTRSIRARILYNHLAIGGIPPENVKALLDSGLIPRIVDHKNYNPRVIEWMTDVVRIEDVPPEKYPAAFVEALDNPRRLWDKAFRKHITPAARHLLISLFLLGNRASWIRNSRVAFESVHAAMCSDLGLPRDPKDFENSLKHLDGSFIVINRNEVDFINPSVRDFLAEYLADEALLKLAMSASRSASMARQIWIFARRSLPWSRLSEVANAALPIIAQVVEKPDTDDNEVHNADRLSLLMEWWSHGENDAFYDAALSLVQKPPQTFNAWCDGAKILMLVTHLRDEAYYPECEQTENMAVILETVAVTIFDGYIPSDDLLSMSDIVEQESCFSDLVKQAASRAIVKEFNDVESTVADMTSESDLDEHGDRLRQLAPRANISEYELGRALEAVDERISTINEDVEHSADPVLSERSNNIADTFDDKALVNLFDSLR